MEIKEEWKIIEEYPDYMISNLGNVKSLKFGKERVLKQEINNKGYFRVGLSKDGKQKNYLVHRLVSQAFLPNPQNLPCVNHKDENPSNNCISNLEFCSYQYNNNYGTRNQRSSKSHKVIKHTQETKNKIGKANSKLILQLSKSGNIILRKYNSAKQASNELNINHSHICECCRGERKTAKGYKWMYYDDYKNRMNNYFDIALKNVS